MAKTLGDISINIAKKVLEIILAPSGALSRELGIKESTKINMISQRRPSDFLNYRTYKRGIDDDFGVYTMQNNRKSFMIEIEPGPYSGEYLENIVFGIIKSVEIDDVSLQFTTYASDNIDSIINNYKAVHGNMDHVNIDGKRTIRKLFDKRMEYYKKWTKETMLDHGAQFKMRNIINIVSVSVNKKTSDHELKSLYMSVMGALESLQPREFNGYDFLSMTQEIFNPERGSYNFRGSDLGAVKLNSQIVSGTKISLSHEEDLGKEQLSIDDIFRVDGTFRIQNQYVTNMIVDKFPKDTSMFEIQNVIFDPFGKELQITIPCRFLATLTIAFDNVRKNAKKQLSKSKWNIGSLAYVGTTQEDKKPEIRYRKEEARNIVDAIENFNELPLDGKLDFTLFSEDKDELKRWATLFKSRMSDLPSGAMELKEETRPISSFINMLYSLPGNYSKTVKERYQRFNILFKKHNAKIAPLYSDFKGFGNPVMLLVGRTGQAQSFSIKDSESSFSWCLIGPPGSGKSVFLNDFILSGIDTGDVIRSIDLGNSQKRTVQLAGGQFENFDPSKNTCLNFFTNIETEIIELEDGASFESIKEEEMTTIVPMVGKMAGVDVDATEANLNLSVSDQLDNKIVQNIIDYSIRDAFVKEGRRAGMQEVYESMFLYGLQQRQQGQEQLAQLTIKIATALEDYVRIDKGNGNIEEGKYYKYYNGANNLEIKKDYFVMELEEVKKKSSEFAKIITMGVLNRMATEAYKRQDVFKWYLVDEASDPLKDPLFVKFLENFALRIRKYGGGIGIITQSLKHFFVNNEAQSLYESLAFKMFLEQDKEAIEEAKNTGRLSLDFFAEELMKTIKKRGTNYSEVMVMHKNKVMISRLKLDPFSALLYSSDQASKNKILETRRKYQLDELETVDFLTRTTEMPDISHDEIAKQIHEERTHGVI